MCVKIRGARGWGGHGGGRGRLAFAVKIELAFHLHSLSYLIVQIPGPAVSPYVCKSGVDSEWKLIVL